MSTVVLEDGPFRIEWNGGRMFNVYALDKEVSVFSGDYDQTLTLEEAKAEAVEWWTGEGWEEGSGKADTQLTVRESAW